jgi:hypothetical protein
METTKQAGARGEEADIDEDFTEEIKRGDLPSCKGLPSESQLNIKRSTTE